MTTLTHRTLALAGAFQASLLVYEIAHKGIADSAAIETNLGSLFKVDADDVLDVYGGLGGLGLGLRGLQNTLRGQSRNTEVIKYLLSLVHLERRLAGNQETNKRLGRGIERIQTQLQHFPMLHENITRALADLYSQTLGEFRPKIMVNGTQLHLNNPNNVAKIRSLLLAGLRSTVLWRQLGGRRWHLLFQRKEVREECQRLLSAPVRSPTLH